MRRIIKVGLGTAVAFAVLAAPASASFDRHFTVFSKGTSSENSKNAFSFTEELFADPGRDDHVGRDRGECRGSSRTSIQCRAVIHLNGEVGGLGEIKVNGNLGRHDNRLNVVGGSGDFNGVAGKLLLGGNNGQELHFDLVR